MKLHILARTDALASDPLRGPAVLLEGDWPEDRAAADRWSLDAEIDNRFAWIDEAASYWSEVAAHEPCAADGAFGTQPAWLNALALRYYLVKLIRVVAFFSEVRRPGFGDEIELRASSGHDEDYADVLGQICRLAGARLSVRWTQQAPVAAGSAPSNASWRRALARFAERFERPLPDPALPRIVFCGNPRLLEPICRASTRLGGRAWWLGDRLTVRAWLRWRSAGWGQLVCNSSLGRQNRLGLPEIGPIDCRDIDLAPAVTRWISHRIAAQGAQQTRIIEQMDRHFACVRPDALVLDEDQTPLHRIAVAAARRHGARSFVVQHGAPGCRFGFAPLEADCFLAWGESTRGQLRRWAVPAERIAIVGSASHGARRVSRPAPRSPNRGPRILLLATVPPRDQRPDAVVAHLNRTTYREMIRIAASVVSRLPAAELIVKPHPRATDDTTLELALVNAPRVPTRIVRGCSLQSGLAEADCVLSCLSSAGIEATLAGLPVIQLAPPGSGPIFPHDEWGMLGTARSEAELERLLNAALTGDQQLRDGGNPRVFAHADDTTPAASRIARLVLDAAYERRQTAAFESLASEAPGPSDGADRRSVRAAG